MALPLLQLPHHVSLPPPLLLTLLRVWLLLMSASALEVIDLDAPELTCSQGLTDCHVSSESPYAAALPDPDDTVNVTDVQLKVILRCSATQDCDPYLQIIIAVQEVSNTREVSEEVSGDHNDEEELFGMNQMAEGSGHVVPPEPRALVIVCVSSPGYIDSCKTLEFKPSYLGLDQTSSQRPTHELLLRKKTEFGIPVVVHVHEHSEGMRNIQNITIPSLIDVCSMKLKGTEKKCFVPRLRADHKRNMVLLQLENTDDEFTCWVAWNKYGEVLAWPKGERETVFPSSFVAPCLCFQVRCNGKLTGESCPFKNHQDALERMQHSASVSVENARMRDGGTGLSWNVTALCRLDAEVRLCKKDVTGGQCEEVTGSRQTLHSHVDAGWRATRSGYWVKTSTKTFFASRQSLLKSN